MDIKYSPSSIYELLNESNTIVQNRYLVHAIGNVEATIYGALLAKYKYYCEHKQNIIIEKEGFFYSTILDLHESTGYGKKAQLRAIKHLAEIGLIEVQLMTTNGCLTAKRHFKIIDNLALINQLLSDGKKVHDSIKFMYAEEYSKSNGYRKKKFNKSENQQCLDDTVDEKNTQNPNSAEKELSTGTERNCRQGQKGTVDRDKRERKSISSKSISSKSILINQSKENNPQKQEKTDVIDTIDFQQAMEYVKEQIFYTSLLEDYLSEKETVDLIINILTEIKTSKKKTARVNGQNLSTAIVQDMFSKLDMLHIQYVLDSLKKNTTEIKNMKAYLTTSLYNAPITYDTHIQTQVNHDMAQPSFYKPSCQPVEAINTSVANDNAVTMPGVPSPTIETEPEKVIQEGKTSEFKEINSNKPIEPISQDKLVTENTEQFIPEENIFPPLTPTQPVAEETTMEQLPEKLLRKLATITLLVSDVKDQEKKNKFIKQLDKEVPSWRTSKNSNAKRLQDKLLSA